MIKIIAIVVYFVIICLFLSPNVIFAQTEDDQDAGQQMIDFNFAGYEDGGKKTWDISAEAADILTDVVHMQQITGKTYGDDDTMQLVADKGDYKKTEGKLHLQDNVVGTSESGAKFTTDSLDWDANEGLITTEDKVHIQKDNMSSTGTGIIAHQELKKVQFQKDVTVNIDREVESGMQRTVITCDGPLDIDYGGEVAIFNDNVVATDEQGKMYADKMTVYFNSKTKKIRKVVCSGNVKIDNDQNSAYSELVTYDSDDQKARLTGRPCLIFYTQSKDENGEGNASPFGN